MTLLMDTQAFLWFVLGDSKLSPSARLLLEEPANRRFLSPASYWELAIKIGLGKYKLDKAFQTFVDEGIAGNGFEVLHIATQHAAALLQLPFHHKDPFDRLLIAQAIVERIPIVSSDALFDKYAVQRLW